MRAIVTCGPSYEPIDEVRRLTNFSTGELGTLLAEALVRAGVETICLRGEAATFSRLPIGARILPFATNDDLAQQLQQLSQSGPWHALFHAAALADYRLRSVCDAHGTPLSGAKISTGRGDLTLHLQSATKLLPTLRALFPDTWLLGWKYELEGNPVQALARAAHRIAGCHTDACILNGRASGPGFTLLYPDGTTERLLTKEELSDQLVQKFCIEGEIPLVSPPSPTMVKP